jgi:hypothetical protein
VFLEVACQKGLQPLSTPCRAQVFVTETRGFNGPRDIDVTGTPMQPDGARGGIFHADAH